MVRLRLQSLPSLQMTLDGQPVTAFRSFNERALLVYLATEAERPHARTLLAGLLWPDASESVARRNLNQTLLNLRAALRDHDPALPLLLVTRQTLQLNPAADTAVDVVAIQRRLASVEAHTHPNLAHCVACLERLEGAVNSYEGPFLGEFSSSGSDLFNEWAGLKREWLQRQIGAALEQLTDAYVQRAEPARAARRVRKIRLKPRYLPHTIFWRWVPRCVSPLGMLRATRAA